MVGAAFDRARIPPKFPHSQTSEGWQELQPPPAALARDGFAAHEGWETQSLKLCHSKQLLHRQLFFFDRALVEPSLALLRFFPRQVFPNELEWNTYGLAKDIYIKKKTHQKTL